MSEKQKISKHSHYDDPSAFYKARNFAKIVETEPRDDDSNTMRRYYPSSKFYTMGKLFITVHDGSDGPEEGYFLSVAGKDAYPTWDEIVWIRYNLIPDAVLMTLLLPNLNAYLNIENDHYKFVFTMEQKGWAIDPIPSCPDCHKKMRQSSWIENFMEFECSDCDNRQMIDPKTWNEEHGNGFLGKQEDKSE